VTENAIGSRRQTPHLLRAVTRADEQRRERSRRIRHTPWSPGWHVRRHYPDVVVYEAELPAGYLGCTDADRGIIWLDSRLTSGEQRATLAHEVGHLELGPGATERMVDDWAARRLIGVTDLAAGLRIFGGLPAVAEELWVDERMVRARIAGLSEDERDWLSERDLLPMVVGAVADYEDGMPAGERS
jgi:hypothetical protein